MKHFLYTRLPRVFVIAEDAVPEKPQRCSQNAAECGLTDFEALGEAWQCKCDRNEERYKAALATALSTKGIEVTNAEYVGNGFDSGGPYVIYSFNNKQVRLRLNEQLCDLPEGFEVKIDTTIKCTAVGCGETDFTPGVFNCRMTVCNRSFQKTATSVPIPEKTQTPSFGDFLQNKARTQLD